MLFQEKESVKPKLEIKDEYKEKSKPIDDNIEVITLDDDDSNDLVVVEQETHVNLSTVIKIENIAPTLSHEDIVANDDPCSTLIDDDFNQSVVVDHESQINVAKVIEIEKIEPSLGHDDIVEPEELSSDINIHVNQAKKVDIFNSSYSIIRIFQYVCLSGYILKRTIFQESKLCQAPFICHLRFFLGLIYSWFMV